VNIRPNEFVAISFTPILYKLIPYELHKRKPILAYFLIPA